MAIASADEVLCNAPGEDEIDAAIEEGNGQKKIE